MTHDMRESKHPRLAGLVLAGGRSRRFGSEKAVAMFRGRPLLAWSLQALDGACEAVAVSAAPGSGAEGLALREGRTVLTDDPAHPPGPLAGVAAGLTWARQGGFELLATLPCDTPFVTRAELETLLANLDPAPAALATTPGGPHPLVAIWSVHFAGPLAARLAVGDHPAVGRILDELGAAQVMFPRADRLLNVNHSTDVD